MFETEITISFLSDWHIGSGLGDGAIADSILNRDIYGLPFIPGRPVKGALREASWRLGQCRPDLTAIVDYLWGLDTEAKASSLPGKITVASGRLPADVYDWLLHYNPEIRQQYVADMTMLRAQTALDKHKMVVPHSLRTIECGIPGIFFISNIAIDAPNLADSWLKTYFTAVCAAVKSIGADRARGLGNCYIKSKHKERVVLPEPIDVEILLQKEEDER